jgi:Cu2+-exporting ATPase
VSVNVGERAGAEARHDVLHVGGMYRGSEGAVVEHALGGRPGVLAVEANPAAQTALVTWDPAVTSLEELRGWVEECGYHCAGRSVPGHVCDPMLDEGHRPEPDAEGRRRAEEAHGGGHGGHAGMSMDAMARDMRNRFLVALAFAVPSVLWSPLGTDVLGIDLPSPFGIDRDVFALLLSLPVVFYSSWIFFRGAWFALRARTLDMMVLVAVAIGVGWAYSVAATFWIDGEVFYEAAVLLATFVLLGHWLEMRARGGANDAVRALLDLAPPRAVVLRDGEPAEVPTAEVEVGDLLLVRPGARVPVDAVVAEGESAVDESMVTGESMPVAKGPGDALVGATINGTGALRATATAVGSDTALAQIVALVQEAQASKAPGQRLADRAAFWLVFVALAGGVGTFLGWYLVAGASVSQSLLFAITVVVITCPDALGLATPMAVMVGTGIGARRGILFKNAAALEGIAALDTVVFDKTGTLTLGEPAVVAVVPAPGADADDVLAAAASVERESEHPLAAAVVRGARDRGLPIPPAEGFESVPGHGVRARVRGGDVVVGSGRMMRGEGLDVTASAGDAERLSGEGRTVVHVARDGRVIGVVAIADAMRPSAPAAVAALGQEGVGTVMLTGDNAATAARVAAEAGVGEVLAEVLPGEKAERVAAIQSAGRDVAMVGDGVNDAPALAQADVGIAIGAGTDVAVETADIVLMRSDPLDVPAAIGIGRATVRKMKQNLAWAVGYNSLALPIAAGAFAPWGLTLRPEIAAITMAGSSIIVALNALALKRARIPGVGSGAGGDGREHVVGDGGSPRPAAP